MLVAAGSSSSAVMAAAVPVLAGPAAAVPQGLSGVPSLVTLAGLEIVENRGLTDPISTFGSAASTWMPLGSFDANSLPIDLGRGIQRPGLDDVPAADHAPTPVVPAVIVAPLTWLPTPELSAPLSDAVDAVLVRNWGDLEGTPEQAEEWAVRHDLNTAPVVMGILGLAWSWRNRFGRPENDRDRRRQRSAPRARTWPRLDRQSQLSRRNQVFPVTGARPSWQGAGFFFPRAGPFHSIRLASRCRRTGEEGSYLDCGTGGKPESVVLICGVLVL